MKSEKGAESDWLNDHSQDSSDDSDSDKDKEEENEQDENKMKTTKTGVIASLAQAASVDNPNDPVGVNINYRRVVHSRNLQKRQDVMYIVLQVLIIEVQVLTFELLC